MWKGSAMVRCMFEIGTFPRTSARASLDDFKVSLQCAGFLHSRNLIRGAGDFHLSKEFTDMGRKLWCKILSTTVTKAISPIFATCLLPRCSSQLGGVPSVHRSDDPGASLLTHTDQWVRGNEWFLGMSS
jgi:hypothetical protein